MWILSLLHNVHNQMLDKMYKVDLPFTVLGFEDVLPSYCSGAAQSKIPNPETPTSRILPYFNGNSPLNME